MTINFTEQVEHIKAVLLKGLEEHQFVDVGTNVSRQLGVSKERLYAAIEQLKEEGYEVFVISIQGPSSAGQPNTTFKVLGRKGTTQADVWAGRTLVTKSWETHTEGES